MVPQSASLERETRFAAGSQHTTTRTRSARSNDCGTNRLAESPPPRAWPVAPVFSKAWVCLAAAEPSRRADLCRSPASAPFVCGWSCVDLPPRTGFRARRTRFAAPGGGADRLCRRPGPETTFNDSQLARRPARVIELPLDERLDERHPAPRVLAVLPQEDVRCAGKHAELDASAGPGVGAGEILR